jgi:hypothetical protein
MRDQPHSMLHGNNRYSIEMSRNSRHCIPDCEPDSLSLLTVGLKDAQIPSEFA